MVRRILRSFLFWLLVGPKPAMPPVPLHVESEPDVPCGHGGCAGCSCVAPDGHAPVEPGVSGPPASPTEAVLAIPVMRVKERELQIAQALVDAKILPDLACILALRAVHDRLTRENAQSGWLLDREPEGGIH